MHIDYSVFIQIAVFLFLANLMRMASVKLKMPPVVLIILTGLFLGPSVLNVFTSNQIIEWIAAVGVLFLLFEAGLETDTRMLKQDSKLAVMPALGGIIVPFATAFFLTWFFTQNVIISVFVGSIFTATSVSISVLTLFDMDKVRSVEGRCIINSAIIDDIIGILLITFIIALTVDDLSTTPSAALFVSVLKILIFFILAIIFGVFIIKPLFVNLKMISENNSVLSLAIGIVFMYSWFAELTGVAAITGAYLAGMFFSRTQYRNMLLEGVGKISKSFFIDIFFISIGLGINIFTGKIELLYLVLFVLLAILSKFVGVFLGAKFSGLDVIRSVRIGTGMIPRGEVAIILANMGLARNLITQTEFSATIVLVIFSGLITPVLLRMSFKKLLKKTFF